MNANNNSLLYSLVIPVYNEEDAIGHVLEKIGKPYNCDEIIVVDDGSTDNTTQIARTFKEIKVIKKPYNQGYGAALKAGVRVARNEWVLTFDGDGQQNIDNLAYFLEAQKEGYDLTIGQRHKNSHKLWWRQPGKWIMQLVAGYLANEKICDINCGIRFFRKSVFSEFTPIYPNGYSISTTMTLAFIGNGYNVKFVPVITHKRIGGKSDVRILRDGFNALILIIRTVSLFNPLKVFVPASAIFGFIGIFLIIYNIIFYGSASKTGISLLSGGIFLFLFGILADQIALLRRQHSTLTNRSVDEKIENDLSHS